MDNNRSPVFLSHTTANAEIMREIAEYLEERNIPCWYAPRNIRPGDAYDLRIAVDLESVVGAVIVLITEEVARSEYVPKEITLAYKYGKKVIPIIIDGAPVPKNLEFILANVHWVDINNYENEEDALDYLIELLELLYKGEEAETGLSDRVRKPVVIKQQANSSLYTLHSSITLKARELFVQPPCFNLLEDILAKSHIIYIHNPHHVGKYTTGVVLLEKLGVDDVFEWSKEASFRQILNHPIKRNAGFIIEIDSLEAFFSYANDHDIERFFQKVTERDAYLVFLSKEEAPFEALQNYSVKLQAPSDHRQLLSNHTVWMEKNEDIQQRMLDWIQSSKFHQLLPTEIYPRYAVSFVAKIRELIIGEITESTFLQSLEINVMNRIKSWFKKSYTWRDLAFYLTIGLYEGERYQTITQKSLELLDIFEQHFGRDDGNQDWIIPSRDEHLLQFHAEVRQRSIQSNAGREMVDGVYLLFPEDVSALWEYVWMQYPTFQGPLVTWLRSLIKKPHKKVEEATMSVLIQLAKKDSQNVRNSIILPLAKSNQHHERLFAARVLEKLAQDEDYLHMVFTLAKSWARQNNNDRLQWSAVVLLGSKVGVAYFPKSLRLLRDVFNEGNPSLVFPLQRSFEQLCKIAQTSKEYETLFFSFWIEWFKDLTEEQFVQPLQFVNTILLLQPKVFFQSSEEWNKQFWIEYMRISYVKNTTRKSVNLLINQWILSASSAKEQAKIAELIYSLYRDETPSNQARLEKFIETGLKKDESQYLPIYQHLISI